MFERAAGSDVIGGFVDQAIERSVTGQSEYEDDAVLLAPRRHFRSAVMANEIEVRAKTTLHSRRRLRLSFWKQTSWTSG